MYLIVLIQALLTRLRPFQVDVAEVDPLQYALKDDGVSYAVERVADMKGNPKGPKKNMTFQVYWIGETEPTWESWKTMHRTAALHDFLNSHRNPQINKLVPDNYVYEQALRQPPSESEEDSSSESDNNI